MVQTIQRGPTLGQSLGFGLQQALKPYLEDQFQQMQQRRLLGQQQQQQQAQQSMLQQALQQAHGIQSNPNLNEVDKVFGLHQALSGHPELAKTLIPQLQQPQKPLSPYQEADLDLRKRNLDIQEKRIIQAKEENRKDLPLMISRFTKTYLQDLGIDPSDKIELDKFVIEGFQNGLSLQDALQKGAEVFDQRKEAIDSAPVVQRPKNSSGEISLAQDEMTTVLQDLYKSGVTNPKILTKAAARGGWRKPEIETMLKDVESGTRPEKKTTSKTSEGSKKVPFDPKNAQHVSRAKQVLAEVGGDRAKANKILAEEFTK